MNRLLVALVIGGGIVLGLSGCATVQVYELEQRFSENPEDPARKKIEDNIRKFLSVSGIPEQPDSYVLNGRYLTLRVPACLAKDVESSISYSVCYRSEPPGKPCVKVR